jgi:processive 1,2-diacylglycerol beta-glucosyltransferase
MKTIIAFASAGGGHQSCAESIYDCLKVKYAYEDSALVDILSYANPFFSKVYSGGYSFLAIHLQFLWLFIFNLSTNRLIGNFLNHISRLFCADFQDFLVNENPQVIISTHYLVSYIASYLKKKKKISSRLLTVITDFAVHPLWITSECDEYIVGSDYTRDLLMAKGVSFDKIKVFGIPIKEDFFNKFNRENKEFTVLLVSGSFGFYWIKDIVKQISEEANLIVVCGKNDKLLKDLAESNYKNLKLFGFTKEMPKVMSQADLLITKPGGLSIAEALEMELPMIFIDGIPGQETRNSKILEQQGCAYKAKNIKILKSLVVDLKTNPSRLNFLRENIRRFKKPKATEEFAKYVCSCRFRPAC